MKKLLILSRLLLLFTILGFIKFSNGQIIINSGPEVTPIDMVECILGEGVLYSNVSFQGADVSRGIFSNGDSTNIGINKGVFLTSGAGYIIPGPNNSSSAGISNGLGGHPTLNAITTATTYDACVLEFDIIPESDTLKLTYVFGSEEYPASGGSSFSDVMGIFVTGPNPLGGYYFDKNMAVVPGTNTPISCITINSDTNALYYIDNAGGLTIQYDGFTTVLVAWLVVIPCAEYHLTIGVADAGDHIYDTGVFLEENSITCAKIDIETHLNPPDVSSSMIEEVVDADIVFKLPNADYAPLTINFEVGGTADPSTFPPGDFEESIPTEITFEEGEDSVSINIRPVYDSIIEGVETLELIVENTLGCMNKYDTVVFNILDYIEMSSQTSPNTVICCGQTLDLWVEVSNGFPPYTYVWEPGGYTYDSITVSPDITTTYYISCTDLTMNSVMDSILVTVFPVCELETFYFETYLNPGLLYDVFGNVTGDTVFIVFPPGTNLNGLIPSFTFSNEECSDTVGTITDFTEPIVYQFIGPGGCMSEWIVVADVEVGQNERLKNEIQIFPNPAKDQISITNAKGNKLIVLNSLGAVVLERRIVEDKLNLDVSDFVEGVYYLQFNNDQQWFVEKVIIDK